jgi:hypothetical protein
MEVVHNILYSATVFSAVWKIAFNQKQITVKTTYAYIPHVTATKLSTLLHGHEVITLWPTLVTGFVLSLLSIRKI